MTISAVQRQSQAQILPQRGCRFIVGRLLKGFALGLAALIVLGVGYQAIATELDRRAYTPPGQLYKVNGHQMHLYCLGEGSPTVILDTGEAALAAWVLPSVAQTTRVCAFDRAGYGWSETRSEARDALHRAAELHGLLEAAEIEAPYVLVGHSLGGLFSRVYRSQYLDEVAGMVLVDATHPDTFERQGESISTMQV